MKRIIALALAASIAAGVAADVNAAQGCGRGAHRGPYGRCIPDGRPGPGRGPVLVVGNFYPGQGYWDGHRYYQHRERWHGNWRYR